MTLSPAPSPTPSAVPEPPRAPLVLLVGPLPEAAPLARALAARGLVTRDVPPADLLAVTQHPLAERPSPDPGHAQAATAGPDASGVTELGPHRVISAVIELDLAGASAIVDKVRALLGCREGGPGSPAALGPLGSRAPLVGIGSAARALEVGLLPTDAVFGRPLPVDDVARFLGEAAASLAGSEVRPRAPHDPPPAEALGIGEAQSVHGAAPRAAAGPAIQPSPNVEPARVAHPAAGSVRPPGRRMTHRPAAPSSSARRDDELLQMAEAEDDAVLEDLSADQQGPSGATIRLGTDIERLLDDAAARVASTALHAEPARPTTPGRRIGDELLRELDELLRVEDPSAVERKVVAAGSARPAAVGIERRAALTSSGSEPPRSESARSSRGRGLSVAGGRPEQPEPTGPGDAARESATGAGPSSRSSAGSRATSSIPDQPRAPAFAPQGAPPGATSGASHGPPTAPRGLQASPAAPAPPVTEAARTPQQPSIGQISAASGVGAGALSLTAQGPPDAAELLRRSTAPLIGIAAGVPPAPQPATHRPPPAARGSDSSAPHFSEPPPSEPQAFARGRWAELVPASEPGVVSRAAGTERAHPPRLVTDAGIGAPPSEASPPAPELTGVDGLDDPLAALGWAIARRVSGVLVSEASARAEMPPPTERRDPTAHRSIVLRDGDVITAASDLEGESLLDFLVERGDLSPKTVQAHDLRLPRSGRHAVAALIAYGFLGQEELWPVLRAHAEWLVTRVLGSETSRSWLEPEIPERLRGEPAVFGGAAGVEVFLEAVRRAVSPAAATRRLGGGQARFFLGDQASLLAEAALPAAVVDALHAARGTTVADWVSRFGESFAPVVLGLLALRVLQAEPRQPARARAVVREDDLDPLDAVAVRERVRARVALVHEGDYFALLGVSPDATEHEVRRAFVELRRRFQPATLLTAATADLHDDVVLILELIEEAYEVLRDPWRRTRYYKALVETARR